MSKQTIASIKAQGTDITPYQVHLVLNQTMELLEVDRQIVPQMMYNYDRNGLIVKGSKGQKRYNWDEVEAFVTRWITKNYPQAVLPTPEVESDEVEGQLELIEM